MISAVILSKNSEKTIAAALDSVSWCDEVIVIDDDSTDKTKNIAISHKAIVIERLLGQDFAAQRNFGLSKAKGEWVLFLDSDECISDLLRDEIQASLKTDKYEGYVFKREDYLFNKKLSHGEVGGVRLLRLAKKNAGTWVRPVHEVWQIKGSTGVLVHPIQHYPHSDVAQFLHDINIYSTINAKYLYEQKKAEPVWFIVVYPLAKFTRNYVFLLGFLDGTPGAILAIMMSFHSFLTRAKLYVLWHPKSINGPAMDI